MTEQKKQGIPGVGWLGSRAVGMARTGLRLAIWSEEQLLAMLPGPPDVRPARELEAAPTPQTPSADESLTDAMNRLLSRALKQGTRDSRTELYRRLINGLVADEARIIGALSDGRPSPLVNVNFRRSRDGSASALENASLIGRAANVALPQLVPRYVTHLLALGLVEVGTEDTSLKDDYELLMAETMVLDALKRASIGPVPARVERLTLRLSSLGQDFWSATQKASP